MGGWTHFALLMLWFVLTEAARVAATVWLSHWTNVADLPGSMLQSGHCLRLSFSTSAGCNPMALQVTGQETVSQIYLLSLEPV